MLQIDFEKIKDSKNLAAYNITSTKNTWSHQRRKRRDQKKLSVLLQNDDKTQEKKEKLSPEATSPSSSANTSMEVDAESKDLEKDANKIIKNDQETVCTCKNGATNRTTTPDLENALNMLAEVQVNGSPTGTKRELEEDDCDYYYEHKRTKTVVGQCACHVEEFYLKALLVVRPEDNTEICIELSWLEGSENREVLHQIMQYIKNNLKLPSK